MQKLLKAETDLTHYLLPQISFFQSSTDSRIFYMTTFVLIAKYLKKKNHIYCPQVSLLNHMSNDFNPTSNLTNILKGLS